MSKKSTRMGFGKRIKELRLKRGWSQKELARRADISERFLQKIESKYPPNITIDTIEKFSRSFNLPLWKLIKLKIAP